MADDITALGGARREEISLMIANALSESRAYTDQKGVELRAYVDNKHDHQKANISQMIMGLETVWKLKLEHNEETADDRHKQVIEKQGTMIQQLNTVMASADETKKEVNRINVKIGFALGILAVINLLVQHFWK